MLVPAGVPVNFTATFDDANPDFVAMSVYDDSGSEPVLLLSPFAMASVRSNVYRGKFTPEAGKLYVVFMAVYTDGTFGTLDTDFTAVEQAAAVICQNLVSPVQNVVGMVLCDGGTQQVDGATFTIFLGDSKTMYLKAVNADSGDPLDLSNVSEIDIPLVNADGTIAHLLYTDDAVVIGQPPVLGKFSAPISEEASVLLQTGTFQSIDVTFTISGEKFTVPFPRALSVYEAR